MKAECDFCDAVAYGNIDQLVELGWARAVITSPECVTVTTCPKHPAEFLGKVDALFASFKRQNLGREAIQ